MTDPTPTPTSIRCLNSAHGKDWTMYHGDCVEVIRQIPDNSVDLQLFSPPFANVYTYSDSPRDMGNCDNEREFMEHYRFLAGELYRTLRPGRLCVIHCKDLIRYRGAHGRAGMHDLPGDLVRVHEEAGFQYHCRVTVWKCPVEEQRKTKNHGLLYKQIRADSSFSRVGMPEYLIVMRKWPENEEQEGMISPVPHTHADFPLSQWQEWASPVWRMTEDAESAWQNHGLPVWMDVNHRDVLNVTAAREDKDERHMCPLSLDLIDRALGLWSNPGDTVLSAFGGVGSEGIGSLRQGRKFVGVELKESYFERACVNLKREEGAEQLGLFG
jgi:DNA modification methylase